MARKKTKPESLIYIGPSMPGLTRHMIFIDGVKPSHVSQMIAQNHHIDGLIVPVSELQQARKDMLTKGHILNFHLTHLAKE